MIDITCLMLSWGGQKYKQTPLIEVWADFFLLHLSEYFGLSGQHPSEDLATLIIPGSVSLKQVTSS